MVGIFTFSGTGNTQIVADNIVTHLIDNGKSVQQARIEDINDFNTLEWSTMDCMLIGYPVYAYNAPKIVIDFAKKIPSSDGMKVYIFKTSGEPFKLNDYSSYYLIRILQNKGYKVLVESHILMPYNIIFRYNDSLVKQMYFTINKRVRKFVNDILNENYQPIKIPICGKIVPFLFRIQYPGARLNGLLYSISKRKCISCMNCIKDCPTNNIVTKNNKFRFKSNCIMCMRCVQKCPVDAIRIGLIQPWVVYEPYDYDKILDDNKAKVTYVDDNTKGYFRLFRKYFDNVD